MYQKKATLKLKKKREMMENKPHEYKREKTRAIEEEYKGKMDEVLLNEKKDIE